MNLKDLVLGYVQQRTVLLVDNCQFEAGKEFAAMRRQPGSEAIANTVDALDYALGLLNQKDAENAALRAKVEELEKQLDSLSNSYATCGNPDCTPTQVCELFFDGCRS